METAGLALCLGRRFVDEGWSGQPVWVAARKAVWEWGSTQGMHCNLALAVCVVARATGGARPLKTEIIRGGVALQRGRDLAMERAKS